MRLGCLHNVMFDTVTNSSEGKPDCDTIREGAMYLGLKKALEGVQQHRLLSLLEQHLSLWMPNNPTSASFVFPSVQQHRLLSLLEQHLSLGMPNNPTSASFPEFLAFCAYESQRWRRAYETPSLCQLHTIYRHPCRFGTGGPFFFKLENRIAGLCTMSTTIK